MKENLRFSLLSFMLMLVGNVMAQGVTFDFDNDYATLFPTITGLSSNDSQDGDFKEATTSTAVGGFTVTVAPDAEATNPSRLWSSSPRLRMYSGTFTVKGTGIKKMEFTGHNKNFNLTASTGTLDGKIWTGEADEVVFTVAKNTQISMLVINSEGGSEPTPEPQPEEVKAVTVAEFNAAAESTDVWYKLTGTVKNLQDGDKFGNFDLEDETGSVYVYGLLAEKGGEKKKFQDLVAAKGIKNGDKLTIIGNRGSYKDKIEVMNAYFVSVESVTPEPEPQVTTINVAKALEIINALDDGATTSEEYQVKGFVVGAPDFQRRSDGTLYGNVNCTIADEKGGTPLLTVFRAKNFDNEPFTEETISSLKEGDEVVIEGQLQKYVSKGDVTLEIKNCYIISINGQTSSVAVIKMNEEKNATAYKLNGQLAPAGYRGIIIKNGKKLLSK